MPRAERKRTSRRLRAPDHQGESLVHQPLWPAHVRWHRRRRKSINHSPAAAVFGVGVLQRGRGPIIQILLLTGESKRGRVVLAQELQRRQVHNSLQDWEEVQQVRKPEKPVDPVSDLSVESLLVDVTRVKAVDVFVDNVGGQCCECRVQTDHLVRVVRFLEVVDESVEGIMDQALHFLSGSLREVFLDGCAPLPVSIWVDAAEAGAFEVELLDQHGILFALTSA